MECFGSTLITAPQMEVDTEIETQTRVVLTILVW